MTLHSKRVFLCTSAWISQRNALAVCVVFLSTIVGLTGAVRIYNRHEHVRKGAVLSQKRSTSSLTGGACCIALHSEPLFDVDVAHLLARHERRKGLKRPAFTRQQTHFVHSLPVYMQPYSTQSDMHQLCRKQFVGLFCFRPCKKYLHLEQCLL